MHPIWSGWFPRGFPIASIVQDLHPRRLLPIFTAATIGSVLNVVYAISLSALIFSGELSEYVVQGTGLAIAATVVINLLMAIGGAWPGAIAMTQEAPAILMVLMVETIVHEMAPASPQTMFTTVVTAIALTSGLAGLGCFLLGHFKAGELIRFVPYPVIGGFLAGTGWLLTQGALSVMLGDNFTVTVIPELRHPDRLLQWVPGTCLGVSLLLVSRRFSHPLLISGMLLGATALFYLTLMLTGTSLSTAREAGLLLYSTRTGGLWHPLLLSGWIQADWGAIGATTGQMMAVALLTGLSVLLNATGLELVTGRDINLNRELQLVGMGNVLGGLGGGMIGFHSLGLSTLSCSKLNATSRLTGLLVVLLCGLFLLLGATAVALVPKVVLGGAALLLGLDFLVVWLYDAWFKMPRLDYSIMVLIMLMMGLVDVLKGIGVGLAVAVVVFVVNYSRIDVTRYALTGATYQSTAARSLHQTRLLQEKGDQTLILQLQGFLFFGTANRLLRQIHHHLGQPSSKPLKFLILNFSAVAGIDSSAVISFIKLKQLARPQNLCLLFVHLAPDIERQLYQSGCLQEDEPALCRVFADLDAGVSWCEEQILIESNWRRQRSLPIAMQLSNLLKDTANAAELRHYLEKVQVDAGSVIFDQDHPANALYFIESGQVTVWMLDGEQTYQLQSLESGNILGEMDFFRTSGCSTMAIAATPAILHRLSRSALQQLWAEQPALAAALQDFMMQVTSDRLLYAHRKINDLMR